MVGGPNHGLAPRNKPLAGLQRDAALIRVSRTRRALFVGAVALSAALAAVVSAVAPGRSLGANPTLRTAASGSKATTTASIGGASANRSSANRSAAAQMPPLASPSELGLQAPDAAPQAAPSQSGGSSGGGSTSQQTTPAPAQQAASQPAPAPASSSGGVVSGGS